MLMTITQFREVESSYLDAQRKLNNLIKVAAPIQHKQLAGLWSGRFISLSLSEEIILREVEEATDKIRPLMDEYMIELSQPYVEG